MTLVERVDEGEQIKAELTGREARAYAPYPYQEAYHKSQARIRAYFTGNQIGKSFSAAHDDNWLATGRHPHRQWWDPPIHIRVAADGFQEMVKGFLVPLYRDQVCDPSELRGGSWDTGYDRDMRTIHYENGSTIQFMSFKQADLGAGPQRFAAVQLHRFRAEEHCPHHVWEENMIRLLRHGGDACICYTPILGLTWEHDEIYEPWSKGEVDPKEIECFTATMDEAPHLSLDMIEAVMRQIPDEKMREVRRRGVWMHLGGMVYAMFDRHVHFVPYDANRVQMCTKTVIIDCHPSKPTAVLWCGVGPDGRLFAYREYREAKAIPEICDDVRRISGENNEDIRRYLIDPNWGWVNIQEKGRGGKSVHEQYRANGIPVEMGSRDKRGRMEQVRTLLSVSPTLKRANLEVMRSCERLAWEFEHKRFKPQTTAMSDGDRMKTIDEDDDLLDDIEYFVASGPRYMGEVVPKRRPPSQRGSGRRILNRLAGKGTRGTWPIVRRV